MMTRCQCFFVIGLLGIVTGSHALLAASPNDLGAVIVTPLNVPKSAGPGFSLLGSDQTGVLFQNRLSDAAAAENQIRLNGSGVALGDVNGDDLPDIYFCRLEGKNVLYLNRGHWRFEAARSGTVIECADQYSSGAALADVDGDDDLDLLVNGVGSGTRLFLNDGQGSFTEDVESGLSREGGPTTIALSDVDQDGDLDVYVVRYRTTTIRSTGFAVLRLGQKRMIRPEDRDQLEITPEGRVLEHGESDTLYLNEAGRFSAVSWTEGRFLDAEGQPLSEAPRDWGLTAMFRDIDQDGDADLYVCNDFHSEDRVWINDGKGGFQLTEPMSLRHTSTFSMSVDFADLNRDGWDDFFVADMLSLGHSRRMMRLAAMEPIFPVPGIYRDRPQFDRNTLQLNRGDGSYAEIASYAGLMASDWTWSAIFLDVDLDGYEDLLCATGHMFDTQDMDAERRIQARGPWPQHLIPSKLLMFPRLPLPRLAFRNKGDLTFAEVGHDWGFDQVGVAHGMALGDLDGDGDLDVVVNNLNAPAGLYRNDASAPRVKVRLVGVNGNPRGGGARISLESDGSEQSQEVLLGGRYLSSDTGERTFAYLGRPQATRLKVRWLNGQVSIVQGVEPDREYLIKQIGANGGETAAARSPSPWFEDVSQRLKHRHVEMKFEDFDREPMLPRRYSRMGPGVSWFDLDADGWEELIVGAGRGGRLSVWQNQASEFQTPISWRASGRNRRDQTGIVGVVQAKEERLVLVGQSNYEDGSPQPARLEVLSLGSDGRQSSRLGRGGNIGPLAVADVEGDGDLDLFLGGHARAKRFPENEASQIWCWQDGKYRLNSELTDSLGSLGLVRGATWIDLVGGAEPDLLVVNDWGGIQLLANEGGRFVDRSEAMSLAGRNGFWNGVAVGDFNGDGQLDFAASNWGLNHGYRPSVDSGKLILHHGDFDGDGQTDLVESYLDRGKEYPLRHFYALARDLAYLPRRFGSLAAYNRASLEEILGEAQLTGQRREVSHFQHTVFMNRGDRFEALPLPVEAQFAPAFGIVVGDADLDGRDDLFLAQNFFAVQPFASRMDAGRGIWLQGEGNGHFSPLPATLSGVEIYGEQRGAALGDFDRDGRPDLVVAQNGAETRLFHNQSKTLGLRVVLKGSLANPQAIGATIRIAYGNQWSGAKPVLAGSGYWSQDSCVKLFPRAGATRVRVRWPDGIVRDYALRREVREIRVSRDGSVELMD